MPVKLDKQTLKRQATNDTLNPLLKSSHALSHPAQVLR